MPRPSRHLSRKRLLPPRPSLEQLRERAKQLFRHARGGEEAALARFQDSHPEWSEPDSEPPISLHDAHWVVAREYGFEGWSKLVAHVEHVCGVQHSLSELSPAALVERLAERDWRAFNPVEAYLTDHIEEAMAAVLGGLCHANPRVRAACAQLLDHGADDSCIAPLREAMNDPVPRVRLSALHSLQCQRCKREPLDCDVVPDMIRMAEQDPSDKVRRGAFGGMGIQPPDLRLAKTLEAAIAREPALDTNRHVAKMLRHHLRACSLDGLLARVESAESKAVRRAAALNLSRHPASPAAVLRLEEPLAREDDAVLRRCLERGLRHHAATG